MMLTTPTISDDTVVLEVVRDEEGLVFKLVHGMLEDGENNQPIVLGELLPSYELNDEFASDLVQRYVAVKRGVYTIHCYLWEVVHHGKLRFLPVYSAGMFSFHLEELRHFTGLDESVLLAIPDDLDPETFFGEDDVIKEIKPEYFQEGDVITIRTLPS